MNWSMFINQLAASKSDVRDDKIRVRKVAARELADLSVRQRSDVRRGKTSRADVMALRNAAAVEPEKF